MLFLLFTKQSHIEYLNKAKGAFNKQHIKPLTGLITVASGLSCPNLAQLAKILKENRDTKLVWSWENRQFRQKVVKYHKIANKSMKIEEKC